MGYRPVTDPRVPKLEKEVAQLQEANNQLTADLHRHRERERLQITKKEPPDKDKAEDELWEAQGEVRYAKNLLRGWITSAVVSAPATVLLTWGTTTAEHEVLVNTIAVFSFAFGLATLISLVAMAICVFSIIPDARQKAEKKQRQFDRITYKELGIDQIIQKELRIE